MSSITPEIQKIIETNPLAFATVDLDGRPNVIGVAFIKVVSPTQLVITDNYMKQTRENLAQNNRVCLAVWDKDWQGAKIVGTAEYFSEGEWKRFVEEMPENEGLPAKGAIVVTVDEVIELR